MPFIASAVQLTLSNKIHKRLGCGRGFGIDRACVGVSYPGHNSGREGEIISKINDLMESSITSMDGRLKFERKKSTIRSIGMMGVITPTPPPQPSVGVTGELGPLRMSLCGWVLSRGSAAFPLLLWHKAPRKEFETVHKGIYATGLLYCLYYKSIYLDLFRHNNSLQTGNDQCNQILEFKETFLIDQKAFLVS